MGLCKETNIFPFQHRLARQLCNHVGASSMAEVPNRVILIDHRPHSTRRLRRHADGNHPRCLADATDVLAARRTRCRRSLSGWFGIEGHGEQPDGAQAVGSMSAARPKSGSSGLWLTSYELLQIASQSESIWIRCVWRLPCIVVGTVCRALVLQLRTPTVTARSGMTLYSATPFCFRAAFRTPRPEVSLTARNNCPSVTTLVTLVTTRRAVAHWVPPIPKQNCGKSSARNFAAQEAACCKCQIFPFGIKRKPAPEAPHWPDLSAPTSPSICAWRRIPVLSFHVRFCVAHQPHLEDESNRTPRDGIPPPSRACTSMSIILRALFSPSSSLVLFGPRVILISLLSISSLALQVSPFV